MEKDREGMSPEERGAERKEWEEKRERRRHGADCLPSEPGRGNFHLRQLKQGQPI